MIPQQQEEARPHSPQEIGAMVDRQMQWVDQFNQNLILTAQALQTLQLALEGKLVR
jgi:hypothetical protein